MSNFNIGKISKFVCIVTLFLFVSLFLELAMAVAIAPLSDSWLFIISIVGIISSCLLAAGVAYLEASALEIYGNKVVNLIFVVAQYFFSTGVLLSGYLSEHPFEGSLIYKIAAYSFQIGVISFFGIMYVRKRINIDWMSERVKTVLAVLGGLCIASVLFLSAVRYAVYYVLLFFTGHDVG